MVCGAKRELVKSISRNTLCHVDGRAYGAKAERINRATFIFSFSPDFRAGHPVAGGLVHDAVRKSPSLKQVDGIPESSLQEILRHA